MTAPCHPSKPVRIEADACSHGEPLHHHRNLVVGAGRTAGEDGPEHNFQYIDEVLDRMLGAARYGAEATLAVGGQRTLEIELSGREPGCRLLAEMVGLSRGDALAAWRSIGEPEPQSREESAALRAAARPQEVCKADAEGRLQFTVALRPWKIASLRQL